MPIDRIVLVIPQASADDSALAKKAASWRARLRAGGLDAVVVHSDDDVVPATAAAAAAAAAAACPSTACALVVPLAAAAAGGVGGSSTRQLLGSSLLDRASLPWSSLAPPGVVLKDDCGPLIRAVVQHNHEEEEARRRRQAAAPAAGPPPPPPPPLVVGYAMRESRERALAEAGLLSFVPRAATGSGRAVVFMPLAACCASDEDGVGGEDGNSNSAAQPPLVPPIVDVVLHKASDYLVRPLRDSQDLAAALAPPLRRLLLSNRENGAAPLVAVVVDPLDAVARCVLDRRDIAALLARAFGPATDETATDRPPPPPPLPVRVRGPRQLFLAEVPAGREALAGALAAAGLAGPPYIVKTAAACGVPHAHLMVLALSDDALWAALEGFEVWRPAPPKEQQQHDTTQAPAASFVPPPYPLVVQEFVDHGGVQHKVYVLGDELVYQAPARPSIPDLAEAVAAAAALRARRSRGGEGAGQAAACLADELVVFDALKSLPTLLPWQGLAAAAAAAAEQPPLQPLDPPALRAVARRLRWATQRQHRSQGAGGGGGGKGAEGLSLFGFDVVVARGSMARSDSAAPPPEEWVVADVNYLPSYRSGGARAAAAFGAVLLKAAARGG